MTNLDSILKSRDITLSIEVLIVKAMDFPVVMYRHERWIIEKAEHQRTDTFELWCWRRLLRVPWTARRSKQSILKEINPEYSLEGLMLKLKLQYFGHLMRRVWKWPWWSRTRGEGGDSGWDGYVASLTPWNEFKQTPGDNEGQESLVCCSSQGHKESDMTELLNSNISCIVVCTVVV